MPDELITVPELGTQEFEPTSNKEYVTISDQKKWIQQTQQQQQDQSQTIISCIPAENTIIIICQEFSVLRGEKKPIESDGGTWKLFVKDKQGLIRPILPYRWRESCKVTLSHMK